MRLLRLLPLLVGVALSAFPCLARAAERPNIIWIMADDLGHGHLGCYGQTKIRTPRIDRLAAEGRRFTQCYAGSSVCAPSRSVLMTGLHTGHTRVRGNSSPIDGRVPLKPDDVTVAEVLKSAGYATGITGKWGLGEPDTGGVPNRQGFDEWLGYLNQRRAHLYYQDYLWKNDRKLVLEGNLDGKRRTYVHDLFSDFALDFIRRHRSGPFFLYVAYTIPHVELAVPEDSAKPYRGKFPETPYRDPRGRLMNQNQPKAVYAGMVSRMDRDVGRIMAILNELGIDDNTIVFFTSDNGAQNGVGTDPKYFGATGKLRGHKGSPYEGGLRVPMIVRWPGHVPPGTTSDQVWAFWDFLPTAAELAGVEPPKGIDGISMLPDLLGRKQRDHEFLYWELPWGGFAQAVRHGDFKAVRPRPGAPLALYDLARDPGEERDLASERPEIVAKIEAYLRGARTPSPHWPLPKPKP